MRKDCYVSSIRLLDKCAYSYILVDRLKKEGDKIEESKTGEFHLEDPGKACMYVTDLIKQHNKNSRVFFHFDSEESYNYVTQMRKIRVIPLSKTKNSEFQELSKQLLLEYVKLNHKHLTPLLEMKMKGRE